MASQSVLYQGQSKGLPVTVSNRGLPSGSLPVMRGPVGALSHGFVRVGLVATLVAFVFISEGVHKGNGQVLPLGRAGVRNSSGISTGIDGTSPMWGGDNDSVYERCDLVVPLFSRVQRFGGGLAHISSCLHMCRNEETHLNASLLKPAFAIVRSVNRDNGNMSCGGTVSCPEAYSEIRYVEVRTLREYCICSQMMHTVCVEWDGPMCLQGTFRDVMWPILRGQFVFKGFFGPCTECVCNFDVPVCACV